MCLRRLVGANPFDYLTELLRHSAAPAATPSNWLPWNYRETLARSMPGAWSDESATRRRLTERTVRRDEPASSRE